ncbi:hypothetical protein UMM65_10660 [Aureibaculum sp. 2210JD6-5]|uniref:hypothetical protein n=1 Tax=Aureibaculum sp. 2210JD6-5 TaxID=3103957 RepID=UPI002AACD21E|nr:hypothetical protein [Aureibaculum sp. 2210JD6-5]MDY7395705.1 hypothetical protein [Aureibaculum sp. 2210JD6-5]
MYRFLLLCISFLLLQGCIKQKSSDDNLIKKEYGYKILDNDSTYVEIDLKKYPTYLKLHNKIQELSCNDSTPNISFKTKNILKTIYFNEFCYSSGMTYCPNLKNIIEITKDSVFKVGDIFPIDSLFYVMKKDYSNYGKDPSYSDSPERIGIAIQYEATDSTDNLIELFDRITRTADSIKLKTPLYIMLWEKIEILPPPPPPIGYSETN